MINLIEKTRKVIDTTDGYGSRFIVTDGFKYALDTSSATVLHFSIRRSSVQDMRSFVFRSVPAERNIFLYHNLY